MKRIDLVKRGLRNLKRNFSRTFLTVLAIAIGAYTLTLTLSVGNALENFIDTSIEDTRTVLFVSKAVEEDPETPADTVAKYDPEKSTSFIQFGPEPTEIDFVGVDEIAQLDVVDGVERVWPDYSFSPEYIYIGEDSKFELTSISVYGYMDDEVIVGEYPLEWDVNDVVVDEIFAATLGFEDLKEIVGETVTLGVLGKDDEIIEKEYSVVGVKGEPTGAFNFDRGLGGGVTIGIEGAEELYTQTVEEYQFSYLNVLIEEDYDNDLAISTIEGLDGGYEATGLIEIVETLTSFVNVVTIALLAFSFIAVIAAAFGIVNTQLMSVFERTKEIGLLKALGMSDSSVRNLFSYESILIGLIGSGFGVLLALLTQYGVNNGFADFLADYGGSAMIIQLKDVAMIMGGLMILSWLSGVIPARKAQKLDPIEALRYE